MKLLPHPIKMNIYKCSKYALVFYMSNVYASENNSWYSIEYNSSIYLSLPYSKDIAKDYLKTRSYRITKTNLRSLRRTIERVLLWFDKSIDKYKDLFFYDENKVLWFNSEYSNVFENTEKGYFDNQMLKFVPAAIDVGSGIKEEGVRIYINIAENILSLSYKELVTLYDIICDININELGNLVINAFRYAIATNRFEDEEAYKARIRNLQLMDKYN